ncbi:MAG: glycosyltransferase [Chloroflexota bacterium]|nr:glycosyltransferase [Chloroflexota bacterium]
MMRIAVFTPYLPYPPDTGGKIRSYHLLRALARRFEVDVYSVYHGDRPSQAAVEALREHCGEVVLLHLRKSWRTRDRIRRVLSPLPRAAQHFHTPRSLQEAGRHLQETGYDLLVADEMCMTPYAELAPELPKIIIRHKVDYAHYREVAQARPWGLEKILDYVEAMKLRRYSQTKMPLYQAFLACSEQDAALIHQDAPGVRELVIPNGADLRTFAPSGRAKAGTPTLLYVGSMHYYPNIDAVKFFFETMYEEIHEAVPDVRVQIVGHAPPPEVDRLGNRPGVEVTGSVPEVQPYYERATVFIVPLRLGGGTRLKIIEAMAMGLPVVSTSIGAEGLGISSGENILIADDAASFTERVLQLLSDPELRARIAERGRRLAEHYDWKKLTKPYPDLVEQVVSDWEQSRR